MFQAPKPSKKSKQKPQSFSLNMSSCQESKASKTTLIRVHVQSSTEGESMFKHGREILFL